MTTTFTYDSGLPYDSNQPYDPYSPSVTPTPVVVLAHLASSMILAADGTFGFWVQDTLDEVAQSVSVIVGTETGDRTVVPSFGVPAQPFNGPDKNEIINAINVWEPRAAANVAINTNDSGQSAVTVAVSLLKGASS